MTDVAFADFDAAFAEPSAKPLQVKLYGRVWDLPATIPAAAVLKVTRLLVGGRGQDDLTTAELFDLAADLIPADTLEAWCGRGLDADQLGAIVTWVMRQYMQRQAGDGPGEAPAPEGAPGSSSNDGGFSKPTSPASTRTSPS